MITSFVLGSLVGGAFVALTRTVPVNVIHGSFTPENLDKIDLTLVVYGTIKRFEMDGCDMRNMPAGGSTADPRNKIRR